MRELQAGLWHWQASHPDLTPSEPWRQEVSSYAIDDGARLLLFDRWLCRARSSSSRPTASRSSCSRRRGTNATRRGEYPVGTLQNPGDQFVVYYSWFLNRQIIVLDTLPASFLGPGEIFANSTCTITAV